MEWSKSERENQNTYVESRKPTYVDSRKIVYVILFSKEKQRYKCREQTLDLKQGGGG